MEDFLKKAKSAKRVIATLSSKQKNELLQKMAKALEDNSYAILEANTKDLKYAREAKLDDALIDRLMLDEQRIKAMADSLRDISSLKEPVGRTIEGWKVESGLNIQKVSIPIGVIGIIYESRPNVTSDAAALCFKSGNVAILKGGKEAKHSNKTIAETLQVVLSENKIPKEIISLLPDDSREGVSKLIKMSEYVDLIIPRGGEGLIKYISENSTVPVIKHDKGLCHTYIDSEVNTQEAISIAVNAKVNRPGVCNAMETLLIHQDQAENILHALKKEFDKEGTYLRGCEKTRKIIDIDSATEEDFKTEYLENILSIKIVDKLEDAIEHISKYGSNHSDAILSTNHNNIEKFLNVVDSSCVYVNASTRFTDGAEFGFGAEVGISTNKLHSRGPMGINDLTTYKFKIYGNGQIK